VHAAILGMLARLRRLHGAA